MIKPIWAVFHTELHELMSDLASMARLVSQIMINSSAALLQADLTLAESAIARGDELDAQHHDTKQRCHTLLALYAPTATDQQTVVTALHIVGHLQHMSHLAQRIAKTVQLTHQNLTIPHDIRAPIAHMSLLASGLAHQAATAIQKPDPLVSDRLAPVNDEVNALHHQLSRLVLATNRSHRTGPAIDAVLIIGHYYKCFADHAMTIAKQASSLAARTDAEVTSAPRKSAGISDRPAACSTAIP